MSAADSGISAITTAGGTTDATAADVAAVPKKYTAIADAIAAAGTAAVAIANVIFCNRQCFCYFCCND